MAASRVELYVKVTVNLFKDLHGPKVSMVLYLGGMNNRWQLRKRMKFR